MVDGGHYMFLYLFFYLHLHQFNAKPTSTVQYKSVKSNCCEDPFP